MFGSYEEGIEMNDGLPVDCPPLIGPNVGVDEVDFTVPGEVSVLSNVMVLSIREFTPSCCCPAF